MSEQLSTALVTGGSRGIGKAIAETLAKAGIANTADSPLYRLAVTRLALHYYENREEVGGSQPMPMGMNWMIEHLRLHTDE